LGKFVKTSSNIELWRWLSMMIGMLSTNYTCIAFC
jgi:hypothetical protein